jgi:hypothetical protein
MIAIVSAIFEQADPPIFQAFPTLVQIFLTVLDESGAIKKF